ncbi:MAG TPA: EAL domain-containing protein [Burkholderiaceae bacterium]|jgi:diguanylate cyclase (GGDEF)-like protein/PAS domain S-box-containing protein
MNALMFMSASFNSMLGVALLLLWRQDRQHLHVRAWGWSWFLLGLGLIIGPAFQDAVPKGFWRDLQSLAASTALMGSLFLQLGGALSYRGLQVGKSLSVPLFLITMLSLAATGSHDYRSGLVLGASVLCLGSFACAVVMWRGGDRAERFVAACFVASGLTHASGPILDEFGRSPITYTMGLYVQTVISLGLILLSVARAHREVRRQSARFTKLAEQSLQGLAVLQDYRIVYANPASLRMFGFADRESAEASMLEELVPLHLRDSAQARHRQVLSQTDARIEWEAARLRRDGRELYVHGLSSQIEWDGAPAELLMMIDETSRQRAVEALRRQALHDELTDLPNRNFAVQRLRELTEPGATPFALASIDLDRFQLINESLGHDVGDALLYAIGRRLDQQLPEGCVLARLGEDQFLVIQEGARDADDARTVAKTLLSLLEQPFGVAGTELYIHVSIGIALFPQDGADAPSLLRAADSAMHRAKGRAGAAYVFFDRATDGANRAQLEAEQSLGRAIVAREFLLEYQPKFEAGSRRLCGMEALVRWERPGRGQVSPVEFIPAAERTGQIKALGELILELACEQMADWSTRLAHVPPVAVNVSPVQFDDPNFATRLLARLDALKLPHGLLEIEITETAAIDHMARVLPQLELLRERGVPCALDDFGTGQSSLTVLRQLPIAIIKLDRTMISPLPEAGAAAIVAATCTLGRSLKLEIVAEGVETEEQARAAESLGCTQLQGFLLGRPMGAAAMEKLLESQDDRAA